MNDEFSVEIGRFRLNVKLTDSGNALQVYCSEGSLVVRSRADNVVEIRPELTWSEETKVKVVTSILRSPHPAVSKKDLATRIVKTLKGEAL